MRNLSWFGRLIEWWLELGLMCIEFVPIQDGIIVQIAQ